MINTKRFISFIYDYSIWILLAVLAALFTSTTSNFLTFQNLINILTYASILGIMVIGQSFTLITGNFDLSMESTMALCGLIGMWLVVPAGIPYYGSGLELPVWIAVPIAFCLGLFISWINGNLITRLKVNNFLVTLAMYIALRGMMLLITNGNTVFSENKAYNFIGTTKIGIVNLPIILMLLCFFIAYFVLKYTKFGRELYSVGANRNAARASGINPDLRIRQVYLISGLMAAFAGFILSARLTNVIATMGKGTVFEVFAAAVIGGISLQGGRGSIIGAFGGVLLLATINSGMNLMNLDVFWVETVRGLIILVAMILDSQKSRLASAPAGEEQDSQVELSSAQPAG